MPAPPEPPALANALPCAQRLRDFAPLKVELGQSEGDIPIELRPIYATDAERARQAYDQLGEKSRRNRFWDVALSLNPTLASSLTATDDRDHIGWIGLRPGDEVFPGYGGGSLWRNVDQPYEAEFAITVLDEWQRHGIATLLFSILWHEGWALGIRRIVGYARPTNVAVCGWWESLGGSILSTRNQHELTLELVAPEEYVATISYSLHSSARQFETAEWLANWQQKIQTA